MSRVSGTERAGGGFLVPPEVFAKMRAEALAVDQQKWVAGESRRLKRAARAAAAAT